MDELNEFRELFLKYLDNSDDENIANLQVYYLNNDVNITELKLINVLMREFKDEFILSIKISFYLMGYDIMKNRKLTQKEYDLFKQILEDVQDEIKAFDIFEKTRNNIFSIDIFDDDEDEI